MKADSMFRGALALPHPCRSPHVAIALAGVLAFVAAACGGEDEISPHVQVKILAFNDFHGNLEPPSGSSGRIVVGTNEDGSPATVDAGGVIYFARQLAEMRAANPNTVVVSAGDLIGASPLLSALFHDEPTIEAMNLAGLDINAVGNHEFDKGADELLRMQYGECHPVDGCLDGTPFGGAAFGFLAANVAYDDGETLFPAYDVREFEGVKVAFIGMTLKGTPEIVTPAGVAGLTFRDEVATVNALVPELQSQGVRAIVVVLHEGGIQTGLYDECEGISGPVVDIVEGVHDEVDVFITGHTHQAYNCVIAGKLVTSAASFGRLITDIDLTLDRETGDVVAASARNTIVTRSRGFLAEVQALLDIYSRQVEPLRNRRIGEVTDVLTLPNLEEIPSGESTMGNVIADAQRAATRDAALGGARIAFMNPGGIRAELARGEVSFGAAFAVQPFGNNLVTMSLSGAQIHVLLEQQWQGGRARILQVSEGFSYTWSASAEDGARVDPSTILLDGEPIDPAASYRVTVNSFLSTGGDGFTVLNDGADRLGGVVDLDALEAYLKANDPLTPPALGRITRVD